MIFLSFANSRITPMLIVFAINKAKAIIPITQRGNLTLEHVHTELCWAPFALNQPARKLPAGG